jgi:hypothetical protein
MIGDRKITAARYYNANYYATAIVAVQTEGIDWAAYIGGAPHSMNMADASEFVAENGDKLSRTDARYYFPLIELPYRS